MIIILTDDRDAATTYLERKGLDESSAAIVTTIEEARAIQLTGRDSLVQLGSVGPLLFELTVK